MRRPSRTINIFNMSALDLFASAMGAFIIIAMILFPYYQKHRNLAQEINQAERKLGECERQNGEKRQRIKLLKRENSAVQRGLKGCREKLKITFLTIVIKWENRGDDVDLHVVDPEGHVFNYKTHNRQRRHYPSTAAKLSVDRKVGPGVEIWEFPAAKSGTYQVMYHFYADRNTLGGTKVRANLYHRDGLTRLRDIILNRGGRNVPLVPVARFVVSSDGRVEVR